MYVPSSDSPLGAVFGVDHLHQFPQKLPYLERNIEQQNLAAWGAKSTACIGSRVYGTCAKLSTVLIELPRCQHLLKYTMLSKHVILSSNHVRSNCLSKTKL